MVNGKSQEGIPNLDSIVSNNLLWNLLPKTCGISERTTSDEFI